MKKLIYLIVLTLILGLVLTGCLLSNVGQVPTSDQSGVTYLTKAGTEADPESFPLYAGQDWEVGEVLVWNNEIEVCVKYRLFDGTGEDPENVVGDGWGLTETHLAVVADFADIPTNKSGNPQVGHFPFGNDELAGVAEDGPYCIDFGDGEGELDVECSDTLVIAAHAVIEKCVTVSETITPELTWTRSSESSVAVYPGYGAQWTKEQGFAILTPDAFVWDGGLASQYFTGYSSRSDISWASWICTQNQSGKSLTGTDLRRFNATFEIPAGYNVTGATLGSVNSGYEDVIPMNDNIYIFMNQELIFWGGTISIAQLDPTRTEFLSVARRDTEPQDPPPSFPETDGWHMAGTFPAVPSGLFVEGTNNLDVFAEELWTGGGMHELGLTLQVEQTTCESESAWAANVEILVEGEEGTIQFSGANWATYFEYTTSYWEEELTIPANGNKVTSTHSLATGHTYQFVASGTCNWRVPPSANGYLADAEYWLRHDSHGEGWTKMDPGSIAIWDGSAAVNIDWGELDETGHIYIIEYTPSADSPMTFYFYDDVYSDNSGSLTLKIYSCFDE